MACFKAVYTSVTMNRGFMVTSCERKKLHQKFVFKMSKSLNKDEALGYERKRERI